MRKASLRIILLVLTLLPATAALQGCGNKGSLYLPPDQSAAPAPNNQPADRK